MFTSRHSRPKSITDYAPSELRLLEFSTVEEIERALDVIWSNPELRELPDYSPDGMSLMLPADAVPVMQVAGLTFKVSDVLAPQDLSFDELAEMRRQSGM